MPKQQTIHGFPITDSTWVPRTRNGAQGYIIIVDRGEGTFQRWVASLWFEGEDGWCQGHYCSELESAREQVKRLTKLYSHNL